MARPECLHFTGYKPCGLSLECNSNCRSFQRRGVTVLIVHLEALGAVVRATSILPAVKRKFPQSQVTWVTQAPAHHLLAHNPYVDRVLTTSSSDLLALSSLQFDFALVVDKSLKAGGVLK
ncbi:MAG: glycosyltransferase family 9 protein, partial [Bdellovibrionales bacterium]|nr:glycosyltransferase family 9 protein [Bdellovibrionales bacterium]